MFHKQGAKLVFAAFAAIVLNVTACSEVQSAFPCGPGAYTDGPDGNHQPMVADACPGASFASWAESRQFGTRQYSLESLRSVAAAGP